MDGTDHDYWERACEEERAEERRRHAKVLKEYGIVQPAKKLTKKELNKIDVLERYYLRELDTVNGHRAAGLGKMPPMQRHEHKGLYLIDIIRKLTS